MKKLLSTAVIVGLMSTSAFAAYWVDGKVHEIRQYGDNTVIKLIKADGEFSSAEFKADLSEEAKKKLFTVILTARSLNSDVSLRYDYGWNAIFIK